MNIRKILFFICIAALAGGCGSNSKTPAQADQFNPKDKSGDPTQAIAPDNINDIWLVASKTCGGNNAAVAQRESYRFDKNHFVKIEQLSSTDTTLCKIGYVYDLIVTSSSSGASYQEAGTLRSSLSKKECWGLQNGNPTGAPISEETGQFGPETIGMKLVATSKNLSLDLTDSQDCRNGTLHLELTTKQ